MVEEHRRVVTSGLTGFSVGGPFRTLIYFRCEIHLAGIVDRVEVVVPIGKITARLSSSGKGKPRGRGKV